MFISAYFEVCFCPDVFLMISSDRFVSVRSEDAVGSADGMPHSERKQRGQGTGGFLKFRFQSDPSRLRMTKSVKIATFSLVSSRGQPNCFHDGSPWNNRDIQTFGSAIKCTRVKLALGVIPAHHFFIPWSDLHDLCFKYSK